MKENNEFEKMHDEYSKLFEPTSYKYDPRTEEPLKKKKNKTLTKDTILEIAKECYQVDNAGNPLGCNVPSEKAIEIFKKIINKHLKNL